MTRPSNDKPRFTDWLTEQEQFSEITDGIDKMMNDLKNTREARKVSKYNRYISWLWEVPLSIITTTLLTFTIITLAVVTIIVSSVILVTTITVMMAAYALDECTHSIRKIWKI
jgi:bacteriorhodopsin